MPGCAVRWRYVEQMAADPRITSLRRSERAVWRLLAQLADDDGVIRKHLSTRYLSRRVEYQPDTVRKAIYVLEGKGLVRTTPGVGRTRSLYAVAAELGAAIAEPEAPPISPAPVRPAGTRGTSTGSSRGASTASGAGVSGPSQQGEIPGIPRQSGINDANSSQSRVDDAVLQTCGESEDVPRELWCEAARLIGVPHKNRRCCHTTERDRQRREAVERTLARRRAEAEAAAERLRRDREAEEGREVRAARGAEAVRAEFAATKYKNPKFNANL